MSEIIDLTTGNFGYGFSDDYKQGYSDGRASIVEELESLKAEFEKDNIYEWGRFKMLYRRSVLEIVDKHIAELKGNKE